MSRPASPSPPPSEPPSSGADGPDEGPWAGPESAASPGGPGEGPPAERVPLSVRLAFGTPSFAGAAMVIPIAVHLTIFYSDVVLVPLGFIALAKAISRALDAITDPLMGWVSDRTRSPWGRRKPWIAIGAPGAALAFFALFSPPEALSGTPAMTWLLTTYVLYYLFHTVYQIPHYGLGPEITQDYHERSSLFGLSEMFTVAGTMVAAALPGLLTSWLGARAGYSTFALIFGTLLVLLYANLLRRVRERPDFAQRPSNPLVPGVRRMMRNPVFRILLVVYVIGSVTGAIPGMMMPYFTTYVLKPENPDLWLSLFLLIYFGSGFVFLPLWVRAARSYGKRAAWLGSFVTAFTGSAALFFVGEGDLLATALILVWAGSSFGARLFLGPAIQADVIDYDELYTGRRREAQYTSLWALMAKFTVIPSMSVPLAILASLGYQPNVEQSETVELAIRSIFALAPAAMAFAAFVVAWSYPIHELLHRRIWRGIEAHKRGESAEDPLTGAVLAPPAARGGVDEETGWFLDHFSLRELERARREGPRPLAWRTAGWAAASLAFAVVTAGSVYLTMTDVSARPGLLVVLEVVASGVALTAFVFHAVRFRAARALASRPFPEAVLRAHVELTRSLAAKRAGATRGAR